MSNRPITAMNRESMTLLEWICAAGVHFHHKAYEGASFSRDPLTDGLRRSDVSKEHLKAWDAGEDPTEWRAFYQKAA